MKTFKSFLFLIALCLGMGFATVKAQDIAAVVTENEDLSTLITAVKQAGLTETLQEAGPYTLFAPKNSGFKDLSKIRLNTLMQFGMEAHLKELLSSHIVKGIYTEAGLRMAIEENGGTLQMQSLSGHPLTLTIDGDKVEIIDHLGEASEVEKADIQASNGIVHIIDEVVIPIEMEDYARAGGYYSDDEFTSRGVDVDDPETKKSMTKEEKKAKDVMVKEKETKKRSDVNKLEVAEVKDIVEMANSLKNTTIAAKAIQTAGLTEEFKKDDNYTIFIPTDEAFTYVPADRLNNMMQSENQEEISRLMRYHLVDNKEKFVDLLDKTDWGEDVKSYKTVAGEKISIQLKDGQFVLTDRSGNTAHIVGANITASNGVIYLIDGVLFPDEGMKYEKPARKEKMKDGKTPAKNVEEKQMKKEQMKKEKAKEKKKKDNNNQ
ncbi:MAG: hypothetical protein DHS20C18_29680 [Saprospiraceae bacterium]|nr:MAG: hypothetical protein DHS20C18_29680 [Saprospiraceae bacterium]